MSSTNDSNIDRIIAAEAADWYIILQSAPGSSAQQEEFADWLRRSPVHVEEFLRLTALQGDLARLPAFRELDVDRLLSEPSAEENVIPLATFAGIELAEAGPAGAHSSRGGEPSAQLAGGPLRRRAVAVERMTSPEMPAARRGGSLRRVASAAALLLALAVTLWLVPTLSWLETERYSTDIGEQRSVTLADGSQVQLNVHSSLIAKLDESTREIRLGDGEALFQVAKDPSRPFRVHTPQATIEAKGTQFNVHVLEGKTIVTLLEGRVEVWQAGGSAATALTPGQQVAVDGRAVTALMPRSVDVASAVAWTQRRLIFEDAPLAEVIAEFNRYSRQPFAIEDPALRNVRITASFNSDNIETFASSLAAAGDLRVSRGPDGVWLIERR